MQFGNRPTRTPATDMTVVSVVSSGREPRSIGVDGAIYGRLGSGGAGSANSVFRTSDGFATVEVGYDFGTAGVLPSGEGVTWATRTTDGYVMIAQSQANDTASIWFSTSFTSGWTSVQTLRATQRLAISQPAISRKTGKTVLLVGEYVNVTPSIASRLFASFDGGATWSVIRTGTTVNTSVNSHTHASQFDPRNSRIWSSYGDGVNGWFGYSDDLGSTWTEHRFASDDPLYINSGQHQPTLVLPLRDVVCICPDGGTFDTGVWQMAKPNIAPVAVHSAIPVECSQQYASAPFGGVAGGLEGYIVFPPTGSGLDYLVIAGTADGGRTWHNVFRQEIGTSGSTSGIVGPDSAGRYALKSVVDDVGTLTMLTAPTWVTT